MDGTQYRAELLKHAAKRGYPPPTVSGNEWVFAESPTSPQVIVDYEPHLSNPRGYLIWAKGVLTSHSSKAPPQRPRYSLKHPKRANPSVNMIDDWLWAECADKLTVLPVADYDRADAMGKWLIFCPPETVDDDWRRVKAAVEAGELSVSAKVATRYNGFERVSPLAIINGEWDGPRRYVICVYTLDWQDRDDVFRHRATLRRLGFNGTLSYKTNEMTRQGVCGSLYQG